MILPYLLALVLSPTSISTAFDAAPTSTQTNISPDIQKIREAVKEKVQEKLKLITSSVSEKKGVIGTITDINQNNITIEYQNRKRSLLVASDIVIIDSKRNKTQLDKIKVGQDILAMGYQNQDEILEVKRLVLIDIKSLQSAHQVTIGKIIDTSVSSPIFVLIPSSNKELQYQVKTDSKTEVLNKQFQKADTKSLTNGQKIIVSLISDPKIPKTYYAAQIINLTDTPSPAPTKSN